MMKVTLSDILKIIGMITAVVVVGGGFYLTVHDNTNGLKDIKTEVAALASKTQTDIDGVDDDIDEAVNDLSAIVTETFRVFDDASFLNRGTIGLVSPQHIPRPRRALLLFEGAIGISLVLHAPVEELDHVEPEPVNEAARHAQQEVEPVAEHQHGQPEEEACGEEARGGGAARDVFDTV